MTFELTRELADQIIFAMEDQENEYVLDLQELELVPIDEVGSEEDDPDQEGRFVPLPEWESVDGYNLMERFVDSLHNPGYRERLREILDSGRGVFRQFKNTVKERPEIAALWYRFKEREMRSLVIDWYGDVCELFGLDPVEPDFAETEDLVLSDFAIREATGAELAAAQAAAAGGDAAPDPAAASDPGTATAPGAAATDPGTATGPAAATDPAARSTAPGPPTGRTAAGLLDLIERHDAAGLEELFADYPEDFRDHLVNDLARLRPPLRSESTLVLWAEGPLRQVAGFLWLHYHRLASGVEIGSIEQVYVPSEFRGLGIAGTLVGACVAAAHKRGTRRLVVRLPGAADVLRPMLARSGFEVVSTTMDLNLDGWGRGDRP